MAFPLIVFPLGLPLLVKFLNDMRVELYLQDMQIELKNLLWDKKKLEEDLQTTLQELKMMELILTEFEEEHNKAIAKN
ncbi:hypothetical protein CJ030_MR0G005051 [Morella rubra]|uniref:Uncharacterized protein n=1 Tax=Morella rubra TaxID=262757 RepID=A0A6A1UKU0_9ROSI|nr:hypothetical protein CJ030_MR0G005051 [Morella rubra]